MGGPGSGARPDAARRRQVGELRRQGLTLAEIGRRLGLSRQLVHHYLKPPAASPAVPCPECGGVAIPAGADLREQPDACPSCVAKRPRLAFRDLLRAQRLAAGLSKAELARRAGVNVRTVDNYERGGPGSSGSQPLWHVLVRLVRVLGPALVTVAGEAEGPGQAAKGGTPRALGNPDGQPGRKIPRGRGGRAVP
jgi:transcriptional regulator with XRE-family HTH domain